MLKRLLCLVPFFLYGCGGGSSPDAPSASSSTPPADSSATTESSAPSTPAADESAAADPVRASVWLTTYDGSQRLAPQAPVAFAEDAASEPNVIAIDVDETQRFQTITGFGASLTDSSAWLIGTRMSEAQRAELMRKLFDANAGIGLSFVRHGIGATDFSLANYTYRDSETFSIDYERGHFLPVLKQALGVNPDLRVMGTPWSAPAWMKSSNALNGGALRPDAYAGYAEYLVNYVQAFAAEGVPVESITVQNEPLHESQGYPTMHMEAREQAAFVANHLGPALTRAGLETKLFVYDHNWDQPDYPLDVLNDAGARQFAAGTAFHCYGGDVSAQSRVHEMHPDKEIRLTECTGSVGSEFGSDMVWWMRNLFIGGTRNWASAVLMWNLALDEKSGPQNGGCTNCRGVVTIDEATGNVTYNGEYYALGHASLAARPGASRIESSRVEGTIDSVAFLNPDGSKGLLVLNDGNYESTFKVRWAGLSFSYTLPAGAVATFRWP
jgi:glucosylceramidase